MRIGNSARILLFSLAAFSGNAALAWGPTGHRITGAIADSNLSGTARAQLVLILGTETLAEAATWPDDMRSDPDNFWQKTASPWHYVTVREGAYRVSDAPPEGDAVTALTHYTAVLRDSNASRAEKAMALRFVVHIIGDLHQPLHVGNGSDRGGNDVKITYFGEPTNLHAVWDSGMIDGTHLSYSEYARWISARMTPAEVIAWSDARPATWITESVALRGSIYPTTSDLSWSYAYVHRSQAEQRLGMAGIRIAAYLNWLFAPRS